MTIAMEEIKSRAEAMSPWYHEIDLGGYTPTWNMQPSKWQWEQTRTIRKQIDYSGKRVLDMGSMDGMWAFEAESLGARTVVASDIYQNNPLALERCLLARFALGKRCTVVPNCDANTLFECLKPYWNNLDRPEQFDIIQCLGLLYHVRDPLKVLGQIRKCLKTGGLMLLETAFWNAPINEPAMRFNSDLGVYNDPTTWWSPNLHCLFEMLRLSLFRVVSEIHSNPDNPTSGRIALIAEAMPVESVSENYGRELGFDYLIEMPKPR